MIVNLDWLKVFYLAGGMLLLAIAIVAYPTLQKNAKEKSSKRQK